MGAWSDRYGEFVERGSIMRILKFIVTGQVIRPDPSCDFSNIAKGTKGYLKALFDFDSDWNGCRKAAVFEKLQTKFPAPIINNECMIPEDALTWRTFKVSVVGEREGYRITTNNVEVEQNG